jgi:hypothetical protein
MALKYQSRVPFFALLAARLTIQSRILVSCSLRLASTGATGEGPMNMGADHQLCNAICDAFVVNMQVIDCDEVKQGVIRAPDR